MPAKLDAVNIRNAGGNSYETTGFTSLVAIAPGGTRLARNSHLELWVQSRTNETVPSGQTRRFTTMPLPNLDYLRIGMLR